MAQETNIPRVPSCCSRQACIKMSVYDSKATLRRKLTSCCRNTDPLTASCSSIGSGVTSLLKISDKCTKVHHFVWWIIRSYISENIENLTKSSSAIWYDSISAIWTKIVLSYCISSLRSALMYVTLRWSRGLPALACDFKCSSTTFTGRRERHEIATIIPFSRTRADESNRNSANTTKLSNQRIHKTN